MKTSAGKTAWMLCQESGGAEKSGRNVRPSSGLGWTTRGAWTSAKSKSSLLCHSTGIPIHPSIHCTGLAGLSLRNENLFQDIESLSHELGVLRAKEDTGELELLEVSCHV